MQSSIIDNYLRVTAPSFCLFFPYQLPYRLHYGNDGYDCTVGFGLGIASTDDLVAHKGAYAIVYGYQGLGRIDKG